ncbi:hypothetical protein PTKIN_Ptkin03bG0065200 [Pterospermum kingtungense]
MASVMAVSIQNLSDEYVGINHWLNAGDRPPTLVSHWSPPLAGVIKVNADTAWCSSSRVAIAAAVARDH